MEQRYAQHFFWQLEYWLDVLISLPESTSAVVMFSHLVDLCL